MAIIKGTQLSGGGAVTIKSTESGLLLAMDARVAWVAKGYGFEAMATSAVASLVVRPTTTAMATLRNNSASKNLFIDEAFAHNLVAVANSEFAIWLCVHPSLAAVTNDITVRNSLNGGAAGGSETSFDNGATVTDDGWFPWGPSGATVAVTTPGDICLANVGCRLVVPPGGGISLQVVSTHASNTFTPGFRWYEVPESEFTNI